MVIMPIIERELRVAGRRGKTYWLRVAAALVAATVCAWVVLGLGRTQQPAVLGSTLFSYLCVLAFAFCLLIGPFITADCISEEKRDGTLGLLFLTELSSFHVVLGKWIATSLSGFYGLLAILPSLGLPLLLGGVTPGEYGRVALAVTNAILFSLSAGMFVSSISREQSKATLGAVALILGFAGLVPGLFVFVMLGVFGRQVNELPPLALISPAYTGALAMDAAYKASPALYWTSLGLVHGFTWLFMILTTVLLPRIWREDPGEQPARRRWWLRLGYTPGWRRAFRRRLESNPLRALAGRMRWPHLVFWMLVSLVAINVYWIAVGSRKNPNAQQFHQNFAYALVFTNRVWITVMACHFFLEARRSGALELLLTSPLPVRTLLRGHGRALFGYFFWPIAAIGLLHVWFVWGMASQIKSPVTPAFSYLPFYIISATNSYLNFLSDVLALTFVGAWFSLSLRKPGLALLLTFTTVILVPWAIGHYLPLQGGQFQARVAGWIQSLPWLQKLSPAGYLALPLGRMAGWVGKNLILILWARSRLHRHFRAAASQTLHPPWSWLRWRGLSPSNRRASPVQLATAGESGRNP